MAKPRKTDTNTGASGGGGSSGKYQNRITFYDGYLDTDDRKWIEDNWSNAPREIFDLLTHAEQFGGVSCKYSERDGKWLAILFGGDTPESGAGFALTARASTATLALFVLAYKACHKFTNHWFASSGGNDTLDFS